MQILGFDVERMIVPVQRLDDFRFSNVGAVKIDVEGHEEEVLLGARETITANKPVLFVEIEERHHPGRSVDIIAGIVALGYDSFYVDDQNHLVDASHFDFVALQDSSNLKRPFGEATAIYINNFVFLQCPLNVRHQMLFSPIITAKVPDLIRGGIDHNRH